MLKLVVCTKEACPIYSSVIYLKKADNRLTNFSLNLETKNMVAFIIFMTRKFKHWSTWSCFTTVEPAQLKRDITTLFVKKRVHLCAYWDMNSYLYEHPLKLKALQLFCITFQALRIYFRGWRNAEEHWLLFQGSWVKFPAITWWLRIHHGGDPMPSSGIKLYLQIEHSYTKYTNLFF